MSFVFHTRIANKKYDIKHEIQKAHLKHGISPIQQLKDIYRLGRSPSKLSNKDYYFMELCAPELHPRRGEFIGDNFRAHMQRDYLDDQWFGIAQDKLTLYAMLKAHELPFPKVQAMVHKFRTWPGAATISACEEMEAFLSGTARYPLFGKPVDGVSSLGVISIESYDAANRSLRLYSGEDFPLDDFWKGIANFLPDGYLLQDRAETHPTIRKWVGKASSTVRVMVALTEKGPEIWRCTWKVPTGDMHADNYARVGNIIVAVDPQSGMTLRALQSSKEGRKSVTQHPDTGEDIVGVQLPDWQAAMELCKKASTTAYYGGKLQGWDILLGAEGPVIIELEGDGGGPTLSQIAQGEGLLNDRLMQHLEWAQKDRARKRK